jgi:hypothetical protein
MPLDGLRTLWSVADVYAGYGRTHIESRLQRLPDEAGGAMVLGARVVCAASR